VIHFSLCCDHAHHFDGWFRSNEDYEKQRAAGLVSCPICGSTKVDKALMTPALATSTKKPTTAAPDQERERDFWQKWQEITRHIRKNADYVGKDFAELARKIHFGEVKPRPIYGEAGAQEITRLTEEGIDILPLLPLPEDQN